MNHTPTPWNTEAYGYRIVESKHDNPVADCKGGDSGSVMEAQANVAFIVRACNAHEALVAVVDKFLDLCTRVNDDDPVAPALLNACEEGLAALKLASGD